MEAIFDIQVETGSLFTDLEGPLLYWLDFLTFWLEEV